MATCDLNDFDLWRRPSGRIAGYWTQGASPVRVRAVSVRQAYWAAANLQQFDERRQIGPLSSASAHFIGV